MSKLSKQAGLLTATDLSRFVIKTLIGMVLARILSQGDYGTYRQLFLVYTTISTLMLLGIPQSLLYFLPRADSEKQKQALISRTINLVSILSLAFALFMLLTAGLIARLMNNPALARLLPYFAIYPVFMFVCQAFNAAMLGLQKPLNVVRFTIFTIITDASTLVVAILIAPTLPNITFALLLSAGMQWLYATISLRKGWNEGFTHILPDKHQLAYSLPLGLSSIVGMLTIQLDKLIISSFFQPEQFAIFAVGAMELPFVGILTNSVNSIILPALSSNADSSHGSAIYRASMRKNALLIFPMVGFCFIFATEIITLLYTDTYSQSASYFRIYLFTMLLRIGSYGIIFQAFNKTKTVLYNSLIVLALNIVLNLVLLQLLGMQGPAISTVLVTYLGVVMYLYLIPRQIGISLKALIPAGAILKTLLATVSAGLGTYLLTMGMTGNILRLASGSIIFSVLYLIIGSAVGAILPYDFQILKNAARSVFQRQG